MKTYTYEEAIKEIPVEATDAELHAFCEWLTDEQDKAKTNGDYPKEKTLRKVLLTLQYHDLWR